jgi:hypothetical protein
MVYFCFLFLEFVQGVFFFCGGGCGSGGGGWEIDVAMFDVFSMFAMITMIAM